MFVFDIGSYVAKDGLELLILPILPEHQEVCSSIPSYRHVFEHILYGRQSFDSGTRNNIVDKGLIFGSQTGEKGRCKELCGIGYLKVKAGGLQV